MKQKLSYLFRSLKNFRQKKVCPFCGNTNLNEVDRKYIVTSLLECKKCGLLHRHPKDNPEWLLKFYQKEYSISDHMVTKLPSPDEIEVLKRNNFASLRDFDPWINALVSKGSTIVDYGCSWGYNVFKMQTAGYKAIGYEISKPRAEFGSNNLNVEIHSDLIEIPKNADVVLSSHVIEHLSNIHDIINDSKTILNQNGLIIWFCPNGNTEYRNREPHTWKVNWGGVHPNYLTTRFYQKLFENNPYLILTGDWTFKPEEISAWDGKSQRTSAYQEGKELLVIAKPNIKIH